MSFPSSPTNGATAIVNNQQFVYNSGTNTWQKVSSSPVVGLFFSNNAPSTSTTTGALVVTGGIGVSGNIYTANIVTTNGIFYPNGATAGGGGVTLTTSNTAPVSPSIGAQWYQGNTDILYEYIQDAAGNNIWLDISSTPNTFSTLTSIGNITAQANISVTGNIISTSSAQSNSTSTGSLVLAGGLGVGGNIYAANILIGSTTKLVGVQNIGLIAGSSAYLTIMGARLGDTGNQVTGVGALEIQGSSGSGSGVQSKIDFVDKVPGGNNLVNSARISVTNSATATNVGQMAFSTYNGSSLVEAMRIYENGNIITPSTTTITHGTVSAITFNANTIGNSGTTFTGGNLTTTGNITAQTANMYAAYHVANTGTYSAAYYYSNGLAFTGGGGSGTPGGSNTFVQFANGTSFGGATYLQYNYVSGNLVSNSTSNATSITTGAVVVSGGIGVNGNVYLGGNVYTQSRVGYTYTANSTSVAYTYYNSGTNSLDTVFG